MARLMQLRVFGSNDSLGTSAATFIRVPTEELESQNQEDRQRIIEQTSVGNVSNPDGSDEQDSQNDSNVILNDPHFVRDHYSAQQCQQMMLRDYLERSEEPHSDIAFVPLVEDETFLDDSTAVQTSSQDDIGCGVNGSGNTAAASTPLSSVNVAASTLLSSVNAAASTSSLFVVVAAVTLFLVICIFLPTPFSYGF